MQVEEKHKIVTREKIVSFNEITVGTQVASLATLSETVRILISDNSEEIINEQINILWGITKEQLVSAADAEIAAKQDEIAKQEALKLELEAIADAVKP